MKIEMIDVDEFKNEIKRRGIEEIGVVSKYENRSDGGKYPVVYVSFFVDATAYKENTLLHYREFIGREIAFDKNGMKELQDKATEAENKLRKEFEGYHIMRAELME